MLTSQLFHAVPVSSASVGRRWFYPLGMNCHYLLTTTHLLNSSTTESSIQLSLTASQFCVYHAVLSYATSLRCMGVFFCAIECEDSYPVPYILVRIVGRRFLEYTSSASLSQLYKHTSCVARQNLVWMNWWSFPDQFSIRSGSLSTHGSSVFTRPW